MTDQLKPCPLCGGIPQTWVGDCGAELCKCSSDGCPLGRAVSMVTCEAWELLPSGDAILLDRYRDECDAWCRAAMLLCYRDVSCTLDMIQPSLLRDVLNHIRKMEGDIAEMAFRLHMARRDRP